MSAWMQKQQARSNRAAAMSSAASDDAAEHAPEQRISMYMEAPPGEVCIEDFERFAIDRLRGSQSPVASSAPKHERPLRYISRWSVSSHARQSMRNPRPVLAALLHVQSDHPRNATDQGLDIVSHACLLTQS